MRNTLLLRVTLGLALLTSAACKSPGQDGAGVPTEADGPAAQANEQAPADGQAAQAAAPTTAPAEAAPTEAAPTEPAPADPLAQTGDAPELGAPPTSPRVQTLPAVALRLVGQWTYDAETTVAGLPDGMPDEARAGMGALISRMTIAEVNGRLTIRFDQQAQEFSWTQTGRIDVFEFDNDAGTVNIVATMTTEGAPNEEEIRLRWMVRFVDDGRIAATDPDMPNGIPSFEAQYTRLP